MQRGHLTRRTAGLVYAIMTILIVAGVSTALAAAAADLEKQIKTLQSAVSRHVVTEPQKAETEWLESQSLIAKLKESDPGNKQLSGLEKTHAALKTTLEKRLNRPIGQAAEQKPGPKPEPPASTKPGDEAKGGKSELPSTVLSYLDRINTALDAVESGIEKFRLQTAKRKITDAKKDMAEMIDRHGKKIPDGNEQVEATRKRLETVSAAYDKAQADADARAAAEADKMKRREAQSKEWLTKIRPFLAPAGPLYLRIGADFNRGTDEEKVGYRTAYDKAKELVAELEKTDFPNGKTYELAGEEMRLTQLVLDYGEDQVREKRDAACKKWIDAFRAYVSTGAGTDKFLVRSPMFGKDHINRQAELLEEAEGVWADYQKAEFPLGKNLALLDLEKEMAEALKEMPEIIRQSQALVSSQIEKEFDRVLAQLERDTGWKADETKMPLVAMKRDVEPLSRGLEEYASTVKPDDPTLASLKKKLDLIHKKDLENRAICATRRYLRPWKYAGSDGEDLEKAAGAIVKKEFPKAQVLRTTLPATSWTEERVLEYTDTTKTAIRYRVTRFMSADVAAKADDGKVYLHGVHIAADRTSSGGWGELYGNVKWSDWMIEENVEKKPPTP